MFIKVNRKFENACRNPYLINSKFIITAHPHESGGTRVDFLIGPNSPQKRIIVDAHFKDFVDVLAKANNVETCDE